MWSLTVQSCSRLRARVGVLSGRDAQVHLICARYLLNTISKHQQTFDVSRRRTPPEGKHGLDDVSHLVLRAEICLLSCRKSVSTLLQLPPLSFALGSAPRCTCSRKSRRAREAARCAHEGGGRHLSCVTEPGNRQRQQNRAEDAARPIGVDEPSREGTPCMRHTRAWPRRGLGERRPMRTCSSLCITIAH